MNKNWINFFNEKPKVGKLVLVYLMKSEKYIIASFDFRKRIRVTEYFDHVWIDQSGNKRICHSFDYWCDFEYFKLGELK